MSVDPPSVRSVGQHLFPTVVQNAYFGVPPDAEIGDIIVLVVRTPGQGYIYSHFSLPPNFVEAPNSPVSNIDWFRDGGGAITGPDYHMVRVFWKRLTSLESGSYTITYAAPILVTGFAVAISGALQTGNPWDVTTQTLEYGGASNQGTTDPSGRYPDVALSPTVRDTLLVWVAINAEKGFTTPPLQFSEVLDLGDIEMATLQWTRTTPVGALQASHQLVGNASVWMGALKSHTYLENPVPGDACVDELHFDIDEDGVVLPQPWMQWRRVASSTALSRSGSYPVSGGTAKNDVLHTVNATWTNNTPVMQFVYGMVTRGGVAITLQSSSRAYLKMSHAGQSGGSAGSLSEVSRVGTGMLVGKAGAFANTAYGIARIRQNSSTMPLKPQNTGWTAITPGGSYTAQVELRFVSDAWQSATIDGGNAQTESSYITGDTTLELYAVPAIT